MHLSGCQSSPPRPAISHQTSQIFNPKNAEKETEIGERERERERTIEWESERERESERQRKKERMCDCLQTDVIECM